MESMFLYQLICSERLKIVPYTTDVLQNRKRQCPWQNFGHVSKNVIYINDFFQTWLGDGLLKWTNSKEPIIRHSTFKQKIVYSTQWVAKCIYCAPEFDVLSASAHMAIDTNSCYILFEIVHKTEEIGLVHKSNRVSILFAKWREHILIFCNKKSVH